ncbi:hypothetical protein VFPFJ_05501 [Purpureocillium lilacinum]|uniref:Uncharacterized protein n=1 Tax=Purpureocillium lilacinum TaxID=33203 RepID=A0A179HGP8_PURLI|nr:hypothetical protein VFPFJ_05501 [Purpureocillium lilacinum]OAQ84556.1 hypothetical protein VFPBJ_03324 [Purpureocillium lilacinum]OAQ89092.1 hypothetical protein VFPFJ_05501 [Purpureocillium lilacinum]
MTSSTSSSSITTADGPEQQQQQLGVRVPWAKLRAWIDAQEAHERERGGPAPLTQGQLEALSVLVSFGEEPDVGGRSHVSELMETLQARQLPLPVFQSMPVNLPVSGHIQLMWRCIAKQYAAKLAMQCIKGETGQAVSASPACSTSAAVVAPSTTPTAPNHASSLAPPPATAKRKTAPTSRSPTPSSTPNPPAHKSKRDDSPNPPPPDSSSGDITTATSPSQHRAVMPTSPDSGRDSSEDVSPALGADSNGVFKQVADLAGRLGLDAPAYRLEPDPQMPGFFDGRAVFRSGGRTPPEGVGAVTAVLGRREARVLVAEGVLAWLREEHRARDAMVQSLWGTGP